MEKQYGKVKGKERKGGEERDKGVCESVCRGGGRTKGEVAGWPVHQRSVQFAVYSLGNHHPRYITSKSRPIQRKKKLKMCGGEQRPFEQARRGSRMWLLQRWRWCTNKSIDVSSTRYHGCYSRHFANSYLKCLLYSTSWGRNFMNILTTLNRSRQNVYETDMWSDWWGDSAITGRCTCEELMDSYIFEIHITAAQIQTHEEFK